MMTPKAFGLTFNQFILLLFLLVVGIGYLFSNKDEEPIATQSLDEIQKKEVTTSPEPITSPFSEPLPLTSPTVVNKWGTLQSQEGKINLRSAPGTTNKAIGYGINGDRVQILDSARDSGGYPWYRTHLGSL